MILATLNSYKSTLIYANFQIFFGIKSRCDFLNIYLAICAFAFRNN